jgi:hypothetical protein
VEFKSPSSHVHLAEIAPLFRDCVRRDSWADTFGPLKRRGIDVFETSQLALSLGRHPLALVASQRGVVHARLRLEPGDLDALLQCRRHERVLDAVEPTLSDTELPQAGVPVSSERLGLDRIPERVGNTGISGAVRSGWMQARSRTVSGKSSTQRSALSVLGALYS